MKKHLKTRLTLENSIGAGRSISENGPCCEVTICQSVCLGLNVGMRLDVEREVGTVVAAAARGGGGEQLGSHCDAVMKVN